MVAFFRGGSVMTRTLTSKADSPLTSQRQQWVDNDCTPDKSMCHRSLGDMSALLSRLVVRTGNWVRSQVESDDFLQSAFALCGVYYSSTLGKWGDWGADTPLIQGVRRAARLFCYRLLISKWLIIFVYQFDGKWRDRAL